MISIKAEQFGDTRLSQIYFEINQHKKNPIPSFPPKPHHKNTSTSLASTIDLQHLLKTLIMNNK